MHNLNGCVNEKFYRNNNLCVSVKFTADGNKNIFFDDKEYECDQILLMKSGGFKQYNGNRVTFQFNDFTGRVLREKLAKSGKILFE